MKKLVTLVLAMLMVFSCCAFAEEITYPLTKEPVTLKIAVKQHANDAVSDFNTKYAIAQAAEVTGVNIEWIPLMGSGSAEQVAVMLAGDLPDVFIGLINDDQIQSNSSLFVPLEGLIKENCPNVLNTYNEYVDGWENFLTFPDGHIYSLMGNYLFNPNNAINGAMWINQTWLKRVGKEMPTTLNELRDVLVAFRDMDADGDGDASNEIPMDWCQKHYAATFWELAFSFGLPQYYDIVDGTVTPNVNTETFRTMLEYYHDLCVEGLANMEGLTQTEDQYFANIAAGKVGVFWGWAPYTYTSDPELQAQYLPTGPLSADGCTFRVMPSRNTSNRTNFVVTTACENVEIALRWWNYMSRDLPATIAARSGPMGLTWDEDGKGGYINLNYTPEDAIAFGYEELAQHAGTSTFNASMGLTNCPPLVPVMPANAEGSTGAVRYSGVSLYEPFYTEQSMSKGIIPSEAKEEFDFTCEGLQDFINSYACSAILDGVTDENWNAYLDGLKSHNYDYYIKFYQNYLDGNF